MDPVIRFEADRYCSLSSDFDFTRTK